MQNQIEIRLESISLVFDELPLLKGLSLSSLLTHEFPSYPLAELTKDQEFLSPRLWNLPEVFNKKLSAFSENSFNEVNKLNRMAELVRYNFSHGVSLTSKEVLRHRLHKQIPWDFLPQAKKEGVFFSKWPLLQTTQKHFISHALHEVEEIMQALVYKIISTHKVHEVPLYLQSKANLTKALLIENLDFQVAKELSWRVDFIERDGFEAEFKLVHPKGHLFAFFESFAVDITHGQVIVHPWLMEISQFQDMLTGISDDHVLSLRDMPILNVLSEIETKKILQYLRGRPVSVELTGQTYVIDENMSQTELRLDETGCFYLQHDARVPGQKNITRKGFSAKTVRYLKACSEGLSYLLNTEAKEVATGSRTKREWDLKLLKHLGILQYILFETLSVHFDQTLSDGSPVENKQNLFAQLSDRIAALLTASSGDFYAKELTLDQLCSKSVLACFEDYIEIIFKSLNAEESFYSENGEVILHGVVAREFRVLYELIKRAALVTQGDTFKRSRTSLLSRICLGEPVNEDDISQSLVFFPTGNLQVPSNLTQSLEAMQTLIPFGFKIYYRNQAIQELDENEFQVDFNLISDTQQKNFNWFELNPKFFLRGEEVDPQHFLSLGSGGVIEFDGKLYLVPKKQLPSLKRLETFWQKLQKGRFEVSKHKNGEKIYQLPRHQTLELLALRASGVPIRGDSEWQDLCAFYDQLGQGERILEMPSSIHAELKSYQNKGVQWLLDLYKLRLGALLADDMGLGKTIQTLSFLEILRHQKEMGHVLIVVPSSLIFNWVSEALKFTPDLPVTVFSAKDREISDELLKQNKDQVVVTTYGLLIEHDEYFNQNNWNVLIFDEAQNLKSMTTKRTHAARSLKAKFKMCLTGTPMENHYGEFYSLVDLLVPGSLGPIQDFRRQFVQAEAVSKQEIDELKIKMKPLLMRRTKKEILDQLPEKQETKISIAFEEKQKEIYRDIALSYNERVQETLKTQGEASVQLQMLTALLRLRQACSDPASLPNVKYDKVPPKLETLLDSLKEIIESGESALVFTQFIQTLEHTAQILKDAGIPVFVMHGGVPTKQRQKILAEFSEMKAGAVLVMTLKTGGVGLNLTKASYVFHLEPWWNPAVENQATDRAHRLGQSKAVQVFRYIMHESLEEKIELLKERKDKKFQSLFSQVESTVEIGSAGNTLTKADFDLLLGL